MTNPGDWLIWLIAALMMIVMFMPFFKWLGKVFKWLGKARKHMSIDSVKIFLMKLKRGWGGIFRFLFITSVGFIGWFWLDPQTIGDTPFSQLTLNHIFKNLFAVGIILGCVRWFISSPDMEDDPYNYWANFSGILLSLIVVIGIIWGGWLK